MAGSEEGALLVVPCLLADEFSKGKNKIDQTNQATHIQQLAGISHGDPDSALPYMGVDPRGAVSGRGRSTLTNTS